MIIKWFIYRFKARHLNLLLEHSGFLFAFGEARRIAFALEIDVIEFL